MKLRYVGESFGPEGLTNGKIYEAKKFLKTMKEICPGL